MLTPQQAFAMWLLVVLLSVVITYASERMGFLEAQLDNPVCQHAVAALAQCNSINELKGAHRVPADPRGN